MKEFKCAIVMSGMGGGYLPDKQQFVCGWKTAVREVISDLIKFELDSCYSAWPEGTKNVLIPKTIDSIDRCIHFVTSPRSYIVIEAEEMAPHEFFEAIGDDPDYAELVEQWSNNGLTI